MFTFDLVQSGLIILLLMTIGEVVSHKMKAVLPSILVSAVLYLGLLWSGLLPAGLIQNSGLTALASLAIMFTVTGMGASTNIRELMDNWRVVALAAISYVGQTLLVILIMWMLFDRNTAFGSLPGGMAVALIVQEQARAVGLPHIVVLSVLLQSVQGLIACPLASWMLRREIHRYQKEGINQYSTAESTPTSTAGISGGSKKPSLTSNRALLLFFLVAWIASRLQGFTGISPYVFCLILGVIFARFKLLPNNIMALSNSQGLLSVMMMSMILDGFSAATPQMFLDLLWPLLTVLVIDIAAILLLSQVFGRLLRFSRPMSFALCLNVMIGFPLNLMIAQDLIDFMISNPEEKELLNRQVAQKMVIAGFTSVTFLATVGAGLLVGWIR